MPPESCHCRNACLRVVSSLSITFARIILQSTKAGIMTLTAHREFFNFLLPWRLRIVPIHGLPFCLRLTSMDPVSSVVNIWDRKVSPSTFLSVLCLTVRLQGTHLVHIFNYQRSQMVWLTFSLLIGRVSANCRVVICWFSQMMAWARQIMDNNFSCFRNSHSFVP